jgi:hypothetical protein
MIESPMFNLKRIAAILVAITSIVTAFLIPTMAFGQDADIPNLPGKTAPQAAKAAPQAAETVPQAAGTYIVTATPTYAHPLTGTIEDKGQNAAIGQGMTESLLDTTALLEAYENGESYVTIRCNLMDNVSRVQLAYQLDGDSEFVAASHRVMQTSEDGTSADLRFALPSSAALVKASMFVTPMGRDIVFFMTFTDPVLGSADFIVTELSAEKDEAGAEQTSSALPAATAQAANQGVEATDALATDKTVQPTATISETAVFAVATVATIAVIALLGFLLYRKRVGNAQS